MRKFIHKYFCLSFVCLLANNGVANTKADASLYDKEQARKIDSFQVPKDFKGSLYSRQGQVKNPMAICFDSKGRLLVTEIHRWRHGVDDIRHRPYMLMDDIKSESNEDRLKMYQKHYDKHPESHYTSVSDRIVVLNDDDQDGRADTSKVYADDFNDILDGPGLGVIERDDKIYYTSIPHLWMLEDEDKDGISDKRSSLQDGFGIRMSYSGHDMHGLVWGPDGKLYWSIGDRGYSFTTKEGVKIHGPNEGAVFRCDPDGSNLEVFYHRLRNPQELQFDQYGNLFTADNDSDKGDMERINYLIEGGDSGWHAGHQNLLAFANKLGFRSHEYADSSTMLNSWMVEKMWVANEDVQPAFILPAIGQVEGGPSGFLYNPSKSFGEEYNNKFFVNIFRGNSPKTNISMFNVREAGAGFKMTNFEVFFTGSNVVDMEFGPDGKMYLSEYNNGGYVNKDQGNIFTLEKLNSGSKDLVKANQQILTQSFSNHSTEKLADLLAWDHQQIRLKAQFELAKRGEVAAKLFTQFATDQNSPLLQRLHAIWGLGMMAKSDKALLRPLELLLIMDPQDQVRIQCARVLGDHRVAEDKLIKALKDPHARVAMYAGIGLGRIGSVSALKAVIQRLVENKRQDRFLEHGLVMALSSMQNSSLLEHIQHESKAVRMAVLLAFRKKRDANLKHFLNDSEKAIRYEAMSAINDLAIAGAQEELANQLTKLSKPVSDFEKLMHHRVINANYYLGDLKSAERLLSYIKRQDLPDSVRQEALAAIQSWNEVAELDETTGLPRADLNRKTQLASLLEAEFADLFKASKGKVLAQVNRLAYKYDYQISESVLFSQLLDDQLIDEVRLSSLSSLKKRQSENLQEKLNLLLSDSSERMRLEAVKSLYEMADDKIIYHILKLVKEGSLAERQQAVSLLSSSEKPEAEAFLLKAMETLVQGNCDPVIMLEVLEGSKKKSKNDFKVLVEAYDKKLAPLSITQKYVHAREGGNADRGRDIFYNHGAAQCLRCHKVKGFGADVGPDLTTIGKNFDKYYLLEAIVDPGAAVTPGFGMTSVTLKSGETHSGIFMGETKQGLKIKDSTGKVKFYKHVNTVSKQAPMSPMPPMSFLLQAPEIRDLVAYLKSLDKPFKKTKSKSGH
jgi:quinoprotein glucose dehydrogenase